MRNGVVGTVVEIGTEADRPSVFVNFPGLGIEQLTGEWLQQEVRPGLVGAIAPAYAITTHVAQGQTMDAGRAVITESTSSEAAYVALTRGRNDTRLYVLDSPTRTQRRLAAESAEFPVLLEDGDLLAAVAERLQHRTALGTATSVDPGALAVHRLSLRPFGELDEPTRQHVAARRVATDRAALHALIDPPPAYIDDYGHRPVADHPHRPIWDRAVRARAEHELLVGHWNPGAANMRQAHETARSAALERLPITELINRLHRPGLGLEGFDELERSLRRRVSNAVEEPAGYLTDLLSQRPPKGDALRSLWDERAALIETVRHRNGLAPTDGVASRSAVGALGRQPSDFAAARDWLAAERIVEHAMNPAQITRDAPRRQAPRLRL